MTRSRTILFAAALLTTLFGSLSIDAWPFRGAWAPGAPSAPVVALSLSSYTLPSAASTTIGTATTTFADGTTTTTAPISLQAGGTATDGSACPASTSNFSVSGGTVSTSSGYSSAYWGYFCLTTSPSGRTPYTQLVQVSQTTPQHSAVNVIGDTNTTALWSYPTYARMLAPEYGFSLSTQGTGDTMTACSAALGTIVSDATGTVSATYTANPVEVLMFGAYEGANYTESSYGSTFRDCLFADATWLTIPGANKQTAAAVTSGNKTGTWSAYSTTGLSTGTCLESSDVSTPATITFSVTTVAGNAASGSTIYTGNVVVWIGAVGTGTNTGTTVTYSVDGGSATSVNIDSYGSATGLQPIYVYGLTNNAAHTVKVSLVSPLGSGTTAIIACGAGTPPRTWATKLTLVGVPYEQSNANSANTAAFDYDVDRTAVDLEHLMLDVLYAPARRYVNSSTDMVSATHLSASGQQHLAQAVIEHFHKCLSSVPAPTYGNALSIGLTCPTFYDPGTSTSTIYVYGSNTNAPPGYNYYTQAAYPNGAQSQLACTAGLPFVCSTPNPYTSAELALGCCSYSGYTGWYSTPTTSPSPWFETPVFATLGTPIRGYTAGTTPTVTGFSVGHAYYHEVLEGWVSSTTEGVHWENSEPFIDTTATYDETTATPPYCFTERDDPDAGGPGGNAGIYLWCSAAYPTGFTDVVHYAPTQPNNTGIVYGTLVENAEDGGGTETIKLYSSNDTGTGGPGTARSPTDPQDFFPMWLERNFAWISVGTWAYVIHNYEFYYERPL